MQQEAVRENLCGFVQMPLSGCILDVGCGDGADLRRIGRRLGPEARLVGADTGGVVLGTAQTATGGDPRFSFLQGNLAQPWPFAGDVFDCVFSSNVLECVSDKRAFVAETARVLRPGGQVVCAHWDWDTQTVDGTDKALVRRILAAYSDWRQPWMADADGWMGRRLWRTFQASELFAGRIETCTLTETEFAPGNYGYEQIHSFRALVRHGLVTAEDDTRFYDDVTAQAARGGYFYSVTLYVYVGTQR